MAKLEYRGEENTGLATLQQKPGMWRLLLWQTLGIPIENAEPKIEPTLALFRQRHAEIGCDYQPLLHLLLREFKPTVVVETGVRTGVSTFYILAALEANTKETGIAGKLWSCDPMYKDKDVALSRLSAAEMHLRGVHLWNFVGKKSAEAFAAPEWPETFDVFIHDSDHGEPNVAFELEYAWQRLNPGGLLVADNPFGEFNQVKHEAWKRFAAAHEIKDYCLLGDTVFVRKPADVAAVQPVFGDLLPGEEFTGTEDDLDKETKVDEDDDLDDDADDDDDGADDAGADGEGDGVADEDGALGDIED